MNGTATRRQFIPQAARLSSRAASVRLEGRCNQDADRVLRRDSEATSTWRRRSTGGAISPKRANLNGQHGRDRRPRAERSTSRVAMPVAAMLPSTVHQPVNLALGEIASLDGRAMRPPGGGLFNFKLAETPIVRVMR